MVVDGRLVLPCGRGLEGRYKLSTPTLSLQMCRLTAVRMQVNSALAESAQALVDMMSLVADQHASMAANCGVQGLMAAAVFIQTIRR